MTDPCKYEVDIAIMGGSVKRIEKTTEELAYLLRGNGEIGLKGKAERNWIAIKALFWINGAVAVSLIGIALDHLFRIQPALNAMAKILATTGVAP